VVGAIKSHFVVKCVAGKFKLNLSAMGMSLSGVWIGQINVGISYILIVILFKAFYKVAPASIK
jgi:hypothetical protein